MGEGHVLGIDAQSLKDESLLALHCVHGRTPEIGRAAREDTVRAFLREKLYNFTLAEAFAGKPWTAIPVTSQATEATTETIDYTYKLPPHIPDDAKLQEDRIVLFSLIGLTDEEIATLKQEMGDTANEITIYNWPHASPASQAEIYHIFQCVKPEAPVRGGQTFVLFVDATHLSGPQRVPVVVVACENALQGTKDRARLSKQEQMVHNHIYLRPEHAQSVKSLWPLIWNPPSRGSVNNVVVNYPLFYGHRHPHNDSAASRTIDWKEPARRYPEIFIPNPNLPVCATGATSPEYVVYILSSVTSEEIRILREILGTQDVGLPLLIELNIVPRLTKAERKRETEEGTETLFHTRLDPLLKFFDTPTHRAVADPPDIFVFLDNEALDHLLSEEAGEDLHVPMATSYRHHHREELGGLVAVEEPAYQFADIPIGEGVESTIANIETGNMWFWELVAFYGGELDISFWPEYKGSLAKEQLNIEWEWS
ncbi:hypothetical protein E8E13_000935 [Curvularia kusanoi]|uniref:Uncharacterized protein n=1 Tax=Curvularia kusanoi TaxID=90978 RepID=A0A9P4TAS9_CURKU|nr:hypothetical protein E8E13_000935 [Curvularia kusanoi]